MLNLLRTGLLLLFVHFHSAGLAQNIGDYRTAQSMVSWANASHWQAWNGTNWISPVSIPTDTNEVYIQASHIATLSVGGSCKNLFISTGTTGPTTGGDGQLALVSYELICKGKLSCYYGAMNTTLNSSASLAISPSTTIPSAPITKAANSNTGRIKFMGNTRSITLSGEWSSGNTGAITSYDIEIALSAGNTAIMEVNMKAFNWIISSGTLDAGLNLVSADNGTTGQGNISINSGAAFTSSRSSNSNPVMARTGATACGNLLVASGGLLELNGLNPKIDAGSITFNGTVKYNKGGAQTLLTKGSATGSVDQGVYNNIILANSGVKTLGLNTTVNGTLSLQGTASMALGSFALSYGTSSTLEYKGAALQNTGAAPAEWPAANGPSNLIIDNASGLAMAVSRTISGTLTLITGIVSTSAYALITLGTAAVVTGGTNTSFINGPLRKIGNSAFVFPVGKVDASQSFSSCHPLEISAPANITDTFTAEYFRASAYTVGYLCTGLYKVSGCEYWQLNGYSSAGLDVSLYANTYSGCTGGMGNNYFGAGSAWPDIRISRFNPVNASWEIAGAGISYTGSLPDLVFKATGITDFGQFTFGTITNTSPLPVGLISFTAKEEKNGNKLSWATATEKDNDHFEMERSFDGINFYEIGNQIGKGNSNNYVEYTFIDTALFISADIYYRLKQIDYSGTYNYSKIVLLKHGGNNENKMMLVSPNPFENNLCLKYYAPGNETIQINILDACGRLIWWQATGVIKGINAMVLDTQSFSKGVYFIVLNAGEGRIKNYKMVFKE